VDFDMKKRTAFIGAILSLIPLGQSILMKTGVVLSSSVVMLSLPEIVNANDADYYFDLARYNFNKGKFNEVISNLNTSIKINPYFAAAYLARCGTKVNIQEYEEAITDCEKAFQLNLQDSNNYIDKNALYSNLCGAKSALGENHSAILDCNTAVMLDSKNSISFKNRGIAKDNLGDIRGACSDWQKASNLGDLEARDYVRKYC
tara:strand:+ start:982 stop:1590 length:609 start_codon:yes stop_codon:yes gene_type:complete